MLEIETAIANIEAFCREKGIKESTFGKQAVGDGKFVGRLRDGKGVTVQRLARVAAFIAEGRRQLATAPEAAA